MKNALIITILFLGIISCKNETKPLNGKFGDLPALPDADMIKLRNETTYIDYIFHELPFSVSQDDKPSIQSNLSLISPQKMGAIGMDCKSIGREFFQIDGTIEYEAEVFFQDGCYGYVFYVNQKPTYANKISQSGITFYNNLIQQAAQMKNQGMNGG